MRIIEIILRATMHAMVAFLLFCQIGCTSNQRYCEGTGTQIGIYVPISGQIYGVQCLNYLNGCVVNANSNKTMTVEREFSATNSYFGCIETIEWSKTKVDVK